MKSFRTDVSLNRSNDPITLKNPILTVGSCFADAIGSSLHHNKFQALVNPFGVTYNPISIHKALLYSITNEPVPDKSFLHNQGIYLNYDFHSEVSATEKAALVAKLSNIIRTVHYFIKKTSHIMVTYGTAWVYERHDTNEIVANCHKMPAKLFHKRLLTEQEIVNSFQAMHTAAKKLNPEVKFILTLSPVRHIKDSLELNSVSKAILRSVCHSIITTVPDTEYFPGYEIMMDDLRDYRFYKADMLHPTTEAEDYIWEKFSDKYFDEETKAFLKKWELILAAIHHKPFHPSSTAHQVFLKETLRKLESLKHTVDVEEEIRIINTQIEHTSH